MRKDRSMPASGTFKVIGDLGKAKVVDGHQEMIPAMNR
jgi:hypothetical protein